MGGVEPGSHLDSLAIARPAELHVGVAYGCDAALHVGLATFSNLSLAMKWRSKDGLVVLLSLVRHCPLGHLGSLKGGDLSHALGVLRVEEQGSLGVDLDRGR